MTKRKDIICEECKGNGYIRTDHNKPITADNTHICPVCQGEGSVGDCRIDYDDEIQYWC
jgi:DnaJ-class molecular chaperone